MMVKIINIRIEHIAIQLTLGTQATLGVPLTIGSPRNFVCFRMKRCALADFKVIRSGC